jgi:type III secretion protein U
MERKKLSSSDHKAGTLGKKTQGKPQAARAGCAAHTRAQMAKEKSADQTEKPTPKRLKDARKDGDVAKSKELTATAGVLCWLILSWLALSSVRRQLDGLFERMFHAAEQVGQGSLPPLWIEAAQTLMRVCLPLLLAGAATGVVVEFLQVGGIFAPKRVAPNASRLNIAAGLQRMFSQDNLVEVLKSVVKTAALAVIFVLVLFRLLPEILRLPLGRPEDISAAHWHALLWMGVWTLGVFFMLAVLDAAYQRYAFTRKLQMSRRDIRQEFRDTEGDPHIKGRRRQLHQDWAQQNMLEAVRKSSAVVVNPEHIAVAILYEPGTTALPIVSAKGEDYEAQLIREAAEEAGVPIMRNVELARGLHENVSVDEYVSAEFFQAIAELLRWAESVRSRR